MWTALRIGFLSLILFSTTAAANPASCVPKAGMLTARDVEQRRKAFAEDRQEFQAATVLVGVDELGRVLAAIDVNGDGQAERFLRFTDQTKIEAPWSRQLRGANVTLTRGTAVIQSQDGDTVVALAAEGADLQVPRSRAKSAFVYPAGVEFTNVTADTRQRATLSELDYNDVHTWPVGFQSDLNAELDAVAKQTGCRRPATV
jgi:hypothetical protein